MNDRKKKKKKKTEERRRKMDEYAQEQQTNVAITVVTLDLHHFPLLFGFEKELSRSFLF